MALVYKAVHETTSRVVALKTVRAPREVLLASIRREMNALERLRHPGVVEIFEGGAWEGRPWYAMELLRGGTLRSRLRRQFADGPPAESGAVSVRGSANTHVAEARERTEALDDAPISVAPASERFPTSEERLRWLLTLVRRLCEPLAYIHGEGVIHRDLTPSNIFVREDDTPVLMDFGLVWHLLEGGSREVLSIELAQAGTIAYMAPEQARGERMDARTDLFSLGCILYEGITGEVPFVAHSWSELVSAHDGPPPPPPSSKAKEVSPALDALVMGLLQQRRRDRIGHALDVAAALADLGAEGWSEVRAATPKAYLYRPQLVNRVELLGRAERHVSALGSGTGSCVLVKGESGIGKTSFVSEVARLASLRGVRVVTGQCIAVGLADGRGITRGRPFYPLAPLLHAVADRCVAQGAAATVTLLGERAKVLAAIEPSLRQLPGIGEFSDPPEVPGEAARRRLIDAFAETLSAFVAERPTMLVLEDLQWADNLTLAFLTSLSERYYAASPVMVVGTFRAEEETGELTLLKSLGHVETLRLLRLEQPEIGAIAAEMMGEQKVPDDLARFLTGQSSGNPFFAAEYLRAAVDEGFLFRDQRGRWKSSGGGSFDALRLPGTLTELVVQRLTALSPSARRIAEVAAVLGRDLDVESLDALSREARAVRDEASFDESLRELTVREVLEGTLAGHVRFVHDKIREIAYERIEPAEKVELHAMCAEFLERRHAAAGTLERAYGTLAHHFEKAGAPRKALSYFDLAGQAAHAVHANQEALTLLGRANELDTRLGGVTSVLENARRQRLLGLNALALGDVNAAFDTLARAASTAGKPWPSSRARLIRRLAAAPVRLVVQESLSWMHAVEPPTEPERELLLEAARAYERLLVVTYFTTSDSLGVALAAFTNVALASRAGGASAERALGYATFAAMCALGGMDGLARSYCRRAIAVGRESGDEVAQTWVLMNVSLVHVHAGRWSEMRARLEEVRAMSRRLGFNRRWEEATTQFSTGCLLSGQLLEAKALNDAHLASVERADPQSKCWATVRDAELAILFDDVEAGLAAAQAGVRLCRDGLARSEWVYALGALALAELYSGNVAAALDATRQCIEWIDKGAAPVFYHVVAYAAVVEVHLTAWAASKGRERRSLAKAVRRDLQRLDKLASGVTAAKARASYWKGIVALRLEGDRRGAARHLRAAVSRAQRVTTEYDEALALAALGEHSLEGSDVARSELADAAVILRRIGATRDLARVERLLRAR